MSKRTFTDEDGKTYVAKEKKPFYKKVWVWVLAIIVIVSFASMGGGEEESNTASDASADTKEETKAEATEEVEEEVLAGIGEELRLGDVVFKVNGTSTATNIGGEFGVDSQGTFLIVDVEVRNEDTESLFVDSSFFKLYSEGKEFEADSSAGIYANDQADFFLTDLNPDLTLKGKVVFDISDKVLNSAEQVLQVQTGVWGTETGKINLK